ncbi:ATP synthase subunit I [Croceicoccus estronivorus]|uniref:ATP synthase subunit I n=1 Tax=Croceicoccus estronivorus TaxID=1172626 RepID=UPI000A863070|nr:ATP synthase subunit I [Croceicoccus estronivorus]
MSILPPPGQLPYLVLWFGAGALLGLAFFTSLRRNVTLYTEGRPVAAGLLHAGRIAILIAVLAGAVHFGAGPLVACTIGLLAGRWLIMRRIRREMP